MINKIELEPKDHIFVGVYSILIFISLKLAFSTHPITSMIGWFWIEINIMSFDSYGNRRKQELRQR